MKILRRKSPMAESIDGQTVEGVQVHRRIQITLEREVVSVLVRSPVKPVEGNPVLRESVAGARSFGIAASGEGTRRE